MSLQNQVREEGIYKARITDYGLLEVDSGAVGITLHASLFEKWVQDDTGGKWHPCNYDAEGTIWVVKKGGHDINTPAMESLVNHAGWNADFVAISQQTWTPKRCQVTVKADVYKGETRHKIAFVNSLNRTPSGRMGNVTKDRATVIQQQLTTKLAAYQSLAPNSTDEDVPF